MLMTLVIPVLAIVLGFLLKKIPNAWIQTVIGGFAYGLGVTVTLGLSKYTWTAGLWNKTIEPYFIDLVDNTVGCFVREFIRGLRSDK